jgi:hypothetical membrane protein
MMSFNMDNRKTASALLLFGIIQWIITVMIAEGIQPNYISSIHYVSTLGTGKTAQLYNTSTIILGITVAVSSILIREFHKSRLFFILFLITGLATVGVGVFPEDSRPMHGIVTPIALIFGALSAMSSFQLHEKPAAYFTVLLGAVSLVTGLWFIPYLGLSVESKVMFLGFYKGTLERIVIYTNLLWVLILGSQLSSNKDS